jgi:hypothetical protein
LNLIDHLPPDSFYAEALANDEDLAEAMSHVERPESRVRFSEWSPEVSALHDIAVRLNVLIQATYGAAGVTPPTLPAPPRPVTASERLENQRRLDQIKGLLDRIIFN